MKIIFDKYTCPICHQSKTFEARHDPTEFSMRRGFTNPNGYSDFFYGRCECGYNLNLSMAIVQEYGTQDECGRWSGPYPCLALERAFIEPHPTKPGETVIHYAYECSRNRRARGKLSEHIAMALTVRDRATQVALNFAGQTISIADGTYELLIDVIQDAMRDAINQIQVMSASANSD